MIRISARDSCALPQASRVSCGNYHERNRMSEDEIRTEIFKLWTKDGPVQMEYVTDSGKTAFAFCTKTSVRHSKRKTSSWLWRARRWHRSTPVATYPRSPIACTRSTEMCGVHRGHGLTMELKSAYDREVPPRQIPHRLTLVGICSS